MASDCNSPWDRVVVLIIACAIRLALFFVDAAQTVLAPFGYDVADWRSSYKNICASCTRWQETRRSLDELQHSHCERGLPRWMDDWRVHMEACDCPTMPASGRWLALSILRQSAEERLKILRRVDQEPDILKVPIISPIFIVSPPRTGTTLLHRLLALDRHNKAFCPWEMITLPDIGLFSRKDLKQKGARMARAAIRVLTPHLSSKHYSDPLEPEECTVAFFPRCGLEATLHPVAVHNTLLRDWKQSLFESVERQVELYKFYKKQMQLAVFYDPQYREQVYDAVRLVLKCPSHGLFLRGLLKVFPDAQLINIIRSPDSTIPSLASLLSGVAEMYRCSPVDMKACGDIALRDVRNMTSCLREVRAGYPNQLTDIHYEQLVSNPIETLCHLYKHLKISHCLEEDFEVALKRYLCDHPPGKHGRHRYTMEEFGLTKATIHKELSEYYREHGLLD